MGKPAYPRSMPRLRFALASTILPIAVACGGTSADGPANDETSSGGTSSATGGSTSTGGSGGGSTGGANATGGQANDGGPAGGGSSGGAGTGGAGTGGAGTGGEAGSGGFDICGGFAGFTCEGDEYCAYEEGQDCGAGDASATCEPRPNGCTFEIDPVCGCDGMTYSNGCLAASAGQGIFSRGECD